MRRIDPAGIALALPDALSEASARVLVGFSGGLDSSVLLHRLNRAPELAGRLRAVHIHHGLHPDADAWQHQCERVCSAWQVPLTCIRVQVRRHTGDGLEAAARTARYAAFARVLEPDSILALAHHQDDQAETVLLRALRGSGIDGLAAMRRWRRFAPGWLWRPLLDIPRAHLHAYAQAHGLTWIEDPGNRETRFDRNYLRHQVLPVLAARWPHAAAALAQVATLQAQAHDLLATGDAAVLTACLAGAADTLDVTQFRQYPPPRRARVLRLWLDTLNLPALPGHAIARIERDLITPVEATQAAFHWRQAELMRWRTLLHARRLRQPLADGFACDWNPHAPLHLPDGGILAVTAPQPIAADVIWRVHTRRGGERLTLPGRAHSHALKHVLQQRAVPPWQRGHLPLISAPDGELLAAGDRIVSVRMRDWLDSRQATLTLKSRG